VDFKVKWILPNGFDKILPLEVILPNGFDKILPLEVSLPNGLDKILPLEVMYEDMEGNRIRCSG